VSWIVIEETLRRHAMNLGVIAFLAIIAMFAVFNGMTDRPGTTWPGLIALFAIVIGCGPIGPEFSSGTLQLILVKPINRAVYLVSRVAGVLLVVWGGALIGFVSEAATRAYSGAVPWSALGTALFNALIAPILIVSVLTLLGSLTRAYFNVAAYWALQILVGVLIAFGRKLPESLVSALRFVQRNVFPNTPSGLDRDWLLLVLTNAAVALVLACLVFRRREVPYGAD
jgi:ABC-type transport system involved in multi-copper enzyme maturation permease subunit